MVMPHITDPEYPLAAGAEAEEGRRPTLVSAPAAASPELAIPGSVRRNFSSKEKLRILGELDRASGIPGAIGAILRREGLYSSAITDWRRQRAAGAYEGLSPVKRGPKPVPAHPLSAEHAQLQRDYKRLEQRLERAEAVIDIQKKVSLLLGLPIESDEKS
jgi:transposase-like protein